MEQTMLQMSQDFSLIQSKKMRTDSWYGWKR
jgi:hypothetical protein